MSGVHDRESPVLVDTNTIIEAHRTRSWRALARGWRVETVEACVTETQTGFQLRRENEAIAAAELRDSLAAVHSVSLRERAELALRKGNIALDEGEDALWAHALGRSGTWVLCGPGPGQLAVRRSPRLSRTAGIARGAAQARGAPPVRKAEASVHKEVA